MTPSNGINTESELKKELQAFNEQSLRLVNAILNRLFDLKPSSARHRLAYLIIWLILAGFIVSLTPYPWQEWRNHLQQFFVYVFQSSDLFVIIGSTFDLVRFIFNAYRSSYVLWYAPAFFLPLFIAYQAASFYLADVFDLEHVGIARKFIRHVALTGGREVIHITGGEIAPEDRDSPIAKIGGPGKVIVSLDSAALFEKADGRPHVIGPTEKEPKHKATLDGFERLRQAFDLRDQFIDLREVDGKNSAVKSRSLDGIPVSATDVRLMFSIDRGGKEPSPERPYPYTDEAIEKQVYKSASKVTRSQPDPSQYDFNFESSMLGLVRGELNRFMSEKKLTEYLASISNREAAKAQEQENKIWEEARSVLEPLEDVEPAKSPQPLPKFTERRDITDLFDEFTKKFTEKFIDEARGKGIELHWIGIGTWDVPVELVAEKHLEAWKMSRENEGLDKEMDKVKAAARTQKILTMIQDVPLAVYEQRIRGITDRNLAFRTLLLQYLKQLNDNFESLRSNQRPIPPTLVAAISYLNRGMARFVSPPPSNIPPTQRERELYDQLMKKIDDYSAVERLIRLEQERNPSASREEILQKLNKDWDDDIAGKWRQ
ncbi:MAG TPA: hypothetical protein VK206_25985 [Anaerolineales bacterium]|nr:hypothetical protein [Anaerolineales bacterium]HLO30997.1 hypothetical protein [Anaerolineales bacterium]